MNILNNKIVQAVLAIAPIAFFALALIFYLTSLLTLVLENEQMEHNVSTKNFMSGIIVFAVLVGIVAILQFVSFIFYIIHAIKNPNLKEPNHNTQIVWVLVIIFGSGLGQLIYYIVEIATRKPRPLIVNDLQDVRLANDYQN